MTMRIVALAVTAFIPLVVYAANIQCMLRVSSCVKSQGTEIPSQQVIEILDRCFDFTNNDLGRVTLRLSYKEISERSGERVTPLTKAWHAYDVLYDSPLKFERKRKAEETSYLEVKRACQTLERDFNDNSNWTK
jgi:hypothetical protein